MEEFNRTTSGFNYVLEKNIAAGTEENPSITIIKMPTVSANKRGINDIGWICNGDNVELYGTLSRNPNNDMALWQEIRANDEINKVTSYLKLVNKGDACRLEMRAVFC